MKWILALIFLFLSASVFANPVGTVTGHYWAEVQYDAGLDVYINYGNGDNTGNLGIIDASTRTICSYHIVYIGDFEGTPGLENGWLRYSIRCSGALEQSHYSALLTSGDLGWVLEGNLDHPFIELPLLMPLKHFQGNEGMEYAGP
ncbi:hypothetical protein GOV11_00455 [Candidatus Woesearchaeota archaeon]|nr:hypothetical protein [Candidatus Woesearchaeota archaeon]